MLDLDHFKAYNDAVGHPAGDELLRTVADALTSSMPSGDNLYRHAGEKFAALLSEQTPQSAHPAAERLRASIEALAIPHPSGETVSISIGVAGLAGHGVSAAELFAQADQALSKAKAKGRNRVEVVDCEPHSRLDGLSAHKPSPSPVEAR